MCVEYELADGACVLAWAVAVSTIKELQSMLAERAFAMQLGSAVVSIAAG